VSFDQVSKLAWMIGSVGSNFGDVAVQCGAVTGLAVAAVDRYFLPTFHLAFSHDTFTRELSETGALWQMPAHISRMLLTGRWKLHRHFEPT